jgi:hypothetical protein
LVAVCMLVMARPANRSSTLPTPTRGTCVPPGGRAGSAPEAADCSPSAGGADPSAARPRKRSRDHRETPCSPCSISRRRHMRRRARRRRRLLVRGHLKDAVRRGVDDPLAGALVLLAQVVQNRGARRGPVSQDAAPGPPGELRDHRIGEPVGVGRERRVEDQPQISQWPVVLSFRRSGARRSVRRPRLRDGRHPVKAAQCPGRARRAAAGAVRRPPGRRCPACRCPRRRRRRCPGPARSEPSSTMMAARRIRSAAWSARSGSGGR